MYITQWKRGMITAPAPMKMPRETTAPMIPQNSTRCSWSCGTLK